MSALLLRSNIEVVVLSPVPAQVDRLGNPTYGEPTQTKVAGVLITPADTSEFGPDRPEGYRVDLTVHFPASYTDSLRGCSIELPPPWPLLVRVVGEPQPYDPALTPGRWNRAADCVVADG